MNVDKKQVLSLNGNWQAIGVKSIKDAFISMNGGNSENPPVMALDINYPVDENGNFDFSQQPTMIPVTWLEWITLPIRSYDEVINSAKYKIRVPSVVVSVNYKKVPTKRIRPNIRNLYEIQGGRCGYSNEKISIKEGNLEHKIPKSKGGKDTFPNLMFVKKEINFKRGNKDLAEVGLKPLFNHKEPKPIPAEFTIKNIYHVDWRWFLSK